MIYNSRFLQVSSPRLIRENIKLLWVLIQILILLFVIITTVNWQREIIPVIHIAKSELNADLMTEEEVRDMEVEYGAVVFPEVR